jgi:hypothetical protein
MATRPKQHHDDIRTPCRQRDTKKALPQLAGKLEPVGTGLIVDRTGALSWAFAVAAVSAVLAMVAWVVEFCIPHC